MDVGSLLPVLVGGGIALGGTYMTVWKEGRNLRLQREHDRELRAEERRARLEDDERSREHGALLQLLKLVDDREGDSWTTYDTYERVQGLAQQVDDAVLHRMAEREAPPVLMRRRAGYVMRTPKSERTSDGHDDSFPEARTPVAYM